MRSVAKDGLKHFKSLGAPPMLIIGASHVSHLENYVTNKHTPARFSKPFENTFFLSVGGTTWEECLPHFRGEGLSPRQEAKEKGNQWISYYQSKIKPLFTIIILGSNSIDAFDRSLRETELHSKNRDIFWRRAMFDFNATFNAMIPHILNTLRVIRNNATYSDLLYVKVLPRSWWHQLTRRLARCVDCYITGRLRRMHRIKEIWVHEVMFDRVERKSKR